ncbi:MAG: hypothetical protein IPM66_17930 [Acidobacteriota bacterium]|nr:MAG: hypothetical protein IPM66_17930 [Acidobacteriota bacterium]
MRRAGLVIAVLVMMLLGSSCANLAKVSDVTIPRLLTPLTTAGFNDLTRQIQPLTDLRSLRAWSVYIRFIDAESAERYREAEAILALQRPDKIRLVVQVPVVKTKLAEMVSEEGRFKVAIYPSEYRRFLTGTNDGDYSEWREKLGERGRSALVSARPFHFTEALLMRPLRLDDPKTTYAIEESLLEEPDPRADAKKGARILRSFYVISEISMADSSRQAAVVRRRFWFDRTQGTVLTRQQIYDQQGSLITEVLYSNYRQLNLTSQMLWPGVITVNRPHDNYSARLTFSEERFDINPELPPNAFALENTDGLPETDLDKPLPK